MSAAKPRPEPPIGGAALFLADAVHDAFVAGQRAGARRVEELIGTVPLCQECHRLVQRAREGDGG